MGSWWFLPTNIKNCALSPVLPTKYSTSFGTKAWQINHFTFFGQLLCILVPAITGTCSLAITYVIPIIVFWCYCLNTILNLPNSSAALQSLRSIQVESCTNSSFLSIAYASKFAECRNAGAISISEVTVSCQQGLKTIHPQCKGRRLRSG